jgi:hypothetical protein
MALCTTPVLAATTVAVSGLADPYLAGQPAGTNCCAGDNAPTESPVLAPITLTPGSFLTFSTTGGTSHAPALAISPTADGDTSFTFNLTPSFGTGISGPSNIHLNALAGVFLGPNVPSGAAPAQLSGTTFSTLSPGLDQIFFIGDGLTGTGTGAVQDFFVPTGATRLFLGILDDGGFFDNRGVITAVISSSASVSPGPSAAPEPSSWAMMLAGLAAIGGAMRSRRKPAVSVAA